MWESDTHDEEATNPSAITWPRHACQTPWDSMQTGSFQGIALPETAYVGCSPGNSAMFIPALAGMAGTVNVSEKRVAPSFQVGKSVSYQASH